MGENTLRRWERPITSIFQWLPLRKNSWQHNAALTIFYGIIILQIVRVFFWDYGIDAGVYRLGGAMVSGAEGRDSPLYGEWTYREGDPRLPFTYPPFAALLFVPLAFFPLHYVSLAFMFATTGVAIFIAGRMVCLLEENAMIPHKVQKFFTPKDEAKIQQRQKTLTLSCVIAILVFNNAWVETVNFSQINALLLLAIVWDVLPGYKHPRLPRYRGVLLGVVSGIKLTPLAFGLMLLIQRDWRSILRMGAGFIGSIACAWVILPEESLQFWTKIILDSSRPGDHAFISNLSLRGMLEHVGVPPSIMAPVWLSLCALTVIGGAVAMTRLLKRGMTWTMVGVNSIVMLLISPISWGHHWIWNVIFLVCFAVTVEASYREGNLSRKMRRIQWGILGAAIVFFGVGAATLTSIFHLNEAESTGSSPILAIASFGVFFALYTVCYWAMAKLPKLLSPSDAEIPW